MNVICQFVCEQACITATRRLSGSLQQHDGESDDCLDNDAVTSPSDCDTSSSCDMSGVNSEQYCSLLESINSLLSDVKLETCSETDSDRSVNNSVVDN